MLLTIAMFVSGDYEDVWALHQKTIRENDGFVKDLSFHTDIHEIPNVYKAFFVMRDEGELVGMVGVKQVTPTVMEVKRLQIAASYQGQGLARKLMEHVMLYARNMGVCKLQLDVSEPQMRARKLYDALGFTVSRIENRILGADNEKFLSTYMEKRLDV